MIAITGGNGQLGRATALELLKRIESQQLVVSVREPEKAAELAGQGVTVRQGDFNDPDSLVRAFAGAEQVLIISGDTPNEVRIRQHRTAVDAAKQAGAQHIVYTSVVDPDPASPFTFAAIHADTEAYIQQSGLDYTFFRNGWYLEGLPMMIGNPVESKAIHFPGGDAKLVFVGRNDIAQGLAIVLTTEGHRNQVYEINTGKTYSFTEIANAVGKQLGESIQYVEIPTAALEAGMRSSHLPDFLVEALTGMSEAVKQHRFEKPSDTLATILGRQPKSLEQFLADSFTLNSLSAS
ncbi:MAG: SDR family oxidoreductase [Ferruginibacter sp.]|nr:SDR family oxidoreductase [Cytophagales bacterium]